MDVQILESPDDVAGAAADLVEAQIARKADSVLGLATGETPQRLYEELVNRNRQRRLSFARVATFNLDEYIGLPADHPQSYAWYMNHHLFTRTDIDPGNTMLPSCPDADDVADVCEAFERAIADSGGIDLQILGIGSNGHIGFNEPTSGLSSRTRMQALSAQTVRDNSRNFERGEPQPCLAITMGIGTILEARRIVLMATGLRKATAVAAAVEGPVSAMCPASALQFHKDVTFLVDLEAASALRQCDYYRRAARSRSRLTSSARNRAGGPAR